METNRSRTFDATAPAARSATVNPWTVARTSDALARADLARAQWVAAGRPSSGAVSDRYRAAQWAHLVMSGQIR